MQDSYLTSKPHCEILDGLRGVATTMVITFHLLEAYSDGNHLNQIINHGYLAAGFFFMLSRFVIGYAYDNRWNKISTGIFFRHHPIRLQPMVVMGSIMGAALLQFQETPCYPAMESVSVGMVLLVMLLGCTLLPLLPKWDIRGWMETYPLNRPAWSLYHKYIGNILYVLFIHKFSKMALTVLVAITACFTIHRCLIVPTGDIISGWALNWEQQYVGLTWLMYLFFSGLLLSRLGWLIRTRRSAFRWCSLTTIVVLSVPRIDGEKSYWINGLYEAFCIIYIFPVIVSMGTGGRMTSKRSTVVCRSLGDISCLVYITHYLLVYIYTAWVLNRWMIFAEGPSYMLFTFMGAFALAYACLKRYDLLVRKWLTERFSKKK